MHLLKDCTCCIFFNLLNWAPVLHLISPSEPFTPFPGEREEKVKAQCKETGQSSGFDSGCGVGGTQSRLSF